MSIRDQQPDFLAELEVKTTEDGGRQTSFKSGYRPQIKFPFSEQQTGAQITFLNKQFVQRGKRVEASIQLLAPEYFQHQLVVEMAFELREGSRVTATGIVKTLLNKDLNSASH